MPKVFFSLFPDSASGALSNLKRSYFIPDAMPRTDSGARVGFANLSSSLSSCLSALAESTYSVTLRDS